MNTRQIVTILIGLGLFILVIILIVRAFSGGGGTETPQVQPTPITSYVDTATEMQVVVSGPIVAQEQHDSIRITVGRDERTIEVLKGYQEEVVASRSFENTQEAYDEFLHALSAYGYANGTSSDESGEKGRCSNGSRYVFTIVDGAREIERRWTTTCESIKGNFVGNRVSVMRLFRTQIPTSDYRDLTRGTNVSAR